jgi:hypothetical protein
MNYFRADAHLIGKMVDKDCLRFTADNLATLITIFSIQTRSGKDVQIAVLVIGDDAEKISRLDANDTWFEVKGPLRDGTPPYSEYHLPAISIKAGSITQIPDASHSLINCEVIGRLTGDPEHIIKSNNFEFVRFTLAVNRESKGKAHYFGFSVFKPSLIERVKKDAKKGATVFSSGELTFFNQSNKPIPSSAIKLENLVHLGK